MALIQITGIEKTFEKGGAETRALRGVDLIIEKGEFLAVVGPSGSGKSTLLQILGLLDAPTAGTYLLDGRDTVNLTEDELAALRNKRMGFVFQSFNLLARTSVLENVKLPLVYSVVPAKGWDAMADECIASVGLSHRRQHESNQLSGGERQRVAVARALVNDPEIIFADEPTGNLDSASGLAVMDLLERLHHEGKTVILITHDRQLAKRAHRAVLVRDGLIAWDGRPADLPDY
jgi:putative ABC transport system ATP-binding protein